MNHTTNIFKSLRGPRHAILLSLLAVMILSGCFVSGAAFSPEAAARRTVLNNPNPDISTDPNSVQILQRLEVGDKTLVMLSFTGTNKQFGPSACLFTYEVRRMTLGGWSTGSGGGGCSNGVGAVKEEPFSVGAGINSGGSSPLDPGHSTVYGQVTSPEIRSIQVTWKDGQVQQVEVINASYLAARIGQFEMQKVEGLNADNEIVHFNEPVVHPEKRTDEEQNNNAKP